MQREYTKDNRSKLINQFIRNSNEQKEEEKNTTTLLRWRKLTFRMVLPIEQHNETLSSEFLLIFFIART